MIMISIRIMIKLMTPTFVKTGITPRTTYNSYVSEQTNGEKYHWSRPAMKISGTVDMASFFTLMFLSPQSFVSAKRPYSPDTTNVCFLNEILLFQIQSDVEGK